MPLTCPEMHPDIQWYLLLLFSKKATVLKLLLFGLYPYQMICLTAITLSPDCLVM